MYHEVSESLRRNSHALRYVPHMLNHKNELEFMYDNRHLVTEMMREVHRRLTGNHRITELRGAPHYLKEGKCSLVRGRMDFCGPDLAAGDLVVLRS